MTDPSSWLPPGALTPFFVATGIFSVGAGAGGYITSLHYEKIVHSLKQDNSTLSAQVQIHSWKEKYIKIEFERIGLRHQFIDEVLSSFSFPSSPPASLLLSLRLSPPLPHHFVPTPTKDNLIYDCRFPSYSKIIHSWKHKWPTLITEWQLWSSEGKVYRNA